MSLLGFLNPFARFARVARIETPAVERNAYGAAPGEAFGVRRLDSARNDRLSGDEWRYATGQSINADLVTDLASSQAACTDLFTNHPFFRGVCKTFARHVVGPRGPSLQVVSQDKRFNAWVESSWSRVFKMPDPRGRLTGAASLRCDVFHLLNGGASLCVLKSVRRDHPVKTGWQTIHPRRKQTPPEFAHDDHVALGVRYDADGRPVTYYLDQSRGVADVHHVPDGQNHTAVSADLVREVFFDEEGEQLAGLPLMHPAVRPARQIREYDDDVMESAQSQAKTTGVLEAAHPEHVLDPDPLPPGGVTISRGQYNAVPIGFKSREVTPTQPMAQYIPFRHERLSELGRAIDMPLIFVLLSSMEGNFSQAQFDGALYAESVTDVQWMLFEQKLEWLLEQVILEGVLLGEIERPAEYTLAFSWPKPPHANIEKFTKAISQQLRDGGISLIEYCAALGYDFEKVTANRQRVENLLQGADLPPAPYDGGAQAALDAAGRDSGAENDDDDSETDANVTSRTHRRTPSRLDEREAALA